MTEEKKDIQKTEDVETKKSTKESKLQQHESIKFAEGMIGVVVHKEFIPCIQLMEKVYTEKKWTEIRIQGTANPNRSEVTIHITFKSGVIQLPGPRLMKKIPSA